MNFPLPWLSFALVLLMLLFSKRTAPAQCITNETTSVDLSSWTVVQYGPFTQGPAAWILSDNNTVAIQTNNADASIYLSPFDLQSDRIHGSWRVDSITDNDFMGFVFGYQDDQHFYLFDWKQGRQSVSGAVGHPGMTVKAITANSRLTEADLYATFSTNSRVRTLYHKTNAWRPFIDYQFTLEFFPGHFSITVMEGSNVLDTIRIADSTYASGRFGFYNHSQDRVRYAGFTRQQLAPRPLISAVADSVVEGIPGSSTNLTFAIHLSLSNCEPTLVDYFIRPGTATESQDYSVALTSGTLTFAPGETNKVIPVTVFGDRFEEADETILLTLSNALSGTIGTPVTTGLIVNDDTNRLPVVVLTQPGPQSCLLLPTNLLVSAQASDPDGQVVRVEFFDGTNLLSQRVDVPYQFTWGKIAEGLHRLYAVAWDNDGGKATSAPVTVTASYPSVLSINNQTVSEGNSMGTASFTVSLTPPSCRPVTVALVTSNGTASAGSDYVALTTNLTFQPGEVSKVVSVPILGDLQIEPDETFFLCLLNPMNGTISNACGLGVILNDDLNFPPAVAIIDPVHGTQFTAPPGIVPIHAEASDSDGFVQQVDFYVDGAYIASSLNLPYTVRWTNNTIGSYLLTAVATDNAGARATSAPVQITIRACNPALTVGELTNQVRCICDEVTFSAQINSPEPFTCVWKWNGGILRDQTNSTLLLQNLKPHHAGTYTLEVKTPCATLSRSATLTLQGAGNQNPVTFSNASRVTITDNNVASPYPSPIEVACVPGALKHVTVTLDGVTHNFPDDIDILLASPAGQAIKLLSDAGGGNKLTDVAIAFSDSATLMPQDAQRIQPGLYHPIDYSPPDTFPAPAPGSLSGTNFLPFLNTNPNGTWALFARDDLGGDAGAINRGWSLTVEWEDIPPRLTEPVMMPNGRFQTTLHGLLRMAHQVEVSTNLIHWTPVLTVTPNSPATTVSIPTPPSGTALFYRAARCP